ncbi:hypothetical protein, conserved [Leishmania tarentolae]|uniref:Uncharacterized protein n=1 Tax=Leishmania tarentolae TaxID=5689 RepID=A0A640KR56_LEITA|nr:hypothetical protein, conserved [Leishmania tarentolae]
MSNRESGPIVGTSPATLHRRTSSCPFATPNGSPILEQEDISQLNVTEEKAAVLYRISPEDLRVLCHHSRESSGPESRDYVDELASSAFQDCHSAAPAHGAYSAQHLATYTDAISSTARDTSVGSLSMVRIRTFHRVDSDESEDEGVAHLSGSQTVRTDNLSDAVNEPVADQDVTIEAIVTVADDGPAGVPHDARDNAPEVVSLHHGTGALTEGTSPVIPGGVWRALYSGERPSEREPSTSSKDLSIEDAMSAVVPGTSYSSALPRHGDFTALSATRKTALEHLRASLGCESTAIASPELERRSPSLFVQREPEKVQVLHSPSNAGISGEHALRPSDSFEDLAKSSLTDEGAMPSENQDSPRTEGKTAASILGELLGNSWISETAAVCPLSESQKAPATDGSFTEGGSRVFMSEKVGTPVKPAEDSAVTAVAAQSVSGSRFLVRPALSADVSGISPIKNDVPSILADLYGTPDMGSPLVATLKTSHGSWISTTSPPHTRRRWSMQGALKAMQSTSVDVATADFHTAQTAPSTASASMEESNVCDRVAVNATIASEASASECSHLSQKLRPNRLDVAAPSGHRRARSGVVVEPDNGSGSGLRLQSNTKAPLPIQKVERSDDMLRVNGQRYSRHVGLMHAESAVAEAPASISAHDCTTLIRPEEWRQQRVKEEMLAKEMAECTFQPLLSPGTRAMVRLARERELERTWQEEEKGAGAQSAATQPMTAGTHSPDRYLDPSTLKSTLQSVYKRLYPAELSAAASRWQILDQEIEYRRLAREELILLRHRCCAAGRVLGTARGGGAPRSRDSFSFFMSTILQIDWEEAAARTTVPRPGEASSLPTQSYTVCNAATPVAVLHTPFISPMAVALLEEKKAKRRYNSRRQAEMQGQHAHTSDAEVGNRTHRRGTAHLPADGSAATHEEESFRVALFDEFLLRQNAYYFNRSRTVRALEKQMTPVFTPVTTSESARLVKNMVSKSLLDETMGPETCSIVEQRERQHVPFTSLLVKHHTSPYVDPCTFKPHISPAARAMREEERRRQRANKQTPAVQQQSFFERLYADQRRREQRREDAKRRAEEEEVEGLTFRPTLNVKCNTHVQSMLNPRNYQPYQIYLLEKRQLLEAKRKEQAAEAQHAEEAVCTFRPKTTKKPAYIAKMAKCFGVLRQQDVEF